MGAAGCYVYSAKFDCDYCFRSYTPEKRVYDFLEAKTEAEKAGWYFHHNGNVSCKFCSYKARLLLIPEIPFAEKRGEDWRRHNE